MFVGSWQQSEFKVKNGCVFFSRPKPNMNSAALTVITNIEYADTEVDGDQDFDV